MADKLVTIGEANSILNDYSVSIPGASNKCATIKELNAALAGISTSVYDKFTFPSDEYSVEMLNLNRLVFNLTNHTIQGKSNNVSFSISPGDTKTFLGGNENVVITGKIRAILIFYINDEYTASFITISNNLQLTTGDSGVYFIIAAE